MVAQAGLVPLSGHLLRIRSHGNHRKPPILWMDAILFTWKPGETIACWFLQGKRIIPGFLRCEMEFVPPQYLRKGAVICFRVDEQRKPEDAVWFVIAVCAFCFVGGCPLQRSVFREAIHLLVQITRKRLEMGNLPALPQFCPDLDGYGKSLKLQKAEKHESAHFAIIPTAELRDPRYKFCEMNGHFWPLRAAVQENHQGGDHCGLALASLKRTRNAIYGSMGASVSRCPQRSRQR